MIGMGMNGSGFGSSLRSKFSGGAGEPYAGKTNTPNLRTRYTYEEDSEPNFSEDIQEANPVYEQKQPTVPLFYSQPGMGELSVASSSGYAIDAAKMVSIALIGYGHYKKDDEKMHYGMWIAAATMFAELAGKFYQKMKS